MSLYGKVGDQVVARENMNNIINPQHPQNPNLYGNNAPNNVNLNVNSNTRFDFTRCIRMRYHNPASIDVSANPSTVRDDFLKQVKEIRAPDLSNIQRILETCETQKQDYSSFLALNVKLDDILAKQKEDSREGRSNVYDTISSNPNTGHTTYSMSNSAQSHLPQNKGYNEFDIQKFVNKFKCAREMAIGYLEAFQNYNDAETNFIANTGWKA